MNATMTEETKKAMTRTDKHEIAGAEATRPGHVFTPAVDIFETSGEITLIADMPGVQKDGLTIDLRESMLTITGTVQPDAAARGRWLVREYETGQFHRQFRLSSAIDQAKIEATLENGVLRLTLPKAEAARPRKIEVRVG